VIEDSPPEGFMRIDFERGGPVTFNSHVGNLYCKRGAKGTREEFVLGFRVQQNMCNPAGGLHGGMMMTVADLVGTMGGGALVGLRKFLPTVSMTCDSWRPRSSATGSRAGPSWCARPARCSSPTSI